MFEQAAADSGSRLSDWFVRGGVALAFLLFGAEKFPADTMWPKFFEQVGIGQWFRYFTGIVEIGGALLLLIPWTAQFGLGILACTMATASLIWVFVFGSPGGAVVTGAFSLGLTAFWFARRGNRSGGPA